MPKDPYIAFLELTKTSLEKDKKNSEFIYTQTDTFVSWIIGFSVTGLLLIISNISSIHTNLKSTAKPIIICLFLTIFLGVLFRYVSYLIIVYYKGLDHYFEGFFGDYQMWPTELDEDIYKKSFDEVLKRLKSDFEVIIEYPRGLSEQEKSAELPKLIEHYVFQCKYSKQRLNLAVNHIAEITEAAFKINKQETINHIKKGITEHKVGFKLKAWNTLRAWLYTLCLLSFFVTIIIVTVYLLQL